MAYFVFDVLDVGGESVRHLPYLERRRILDGLDLADGMRVQVPPNMTGVDGSALMAIAAEHGIEGIVAKRADSIYRPGIRSTSWLKTPIRHSRDGIICGFVPTGGPPVDRWRRCCSELTTTTAVWCISAVWERVSPIVRAAKYAIP